MTLRSRILDGVNSSTTAVGGDSDVNAVDSDFVVILAALLCALICVLGLVAVARCAWIRRFSANSALMAAPANKGLKKNILRSLPKLTYSADGDGQGVRSSDCAICLTEFVTGDEIRLLPQCGHGFHVRCIDTWLGSHSSCPSCRQILGMGARCQKCGELPSSSVTGPESTAGALNQSADHMINRFLP